MAEQTENLDDFVNSLGNDSNTTNDGKTFNKEQEQKMNNSEDNNENVVVEDNENSAEEVKPGSNNTYTQEQVNEIISRRLARFKHDAIQIGVKEQTKDLEARLSTLENERNAALREAEVLRISSETGVKSELLKKTGLSGADLEDFAKDLKGQISSNSSALTLDDLVVKGSANTKDDLDDFYNNLLGGK